MGSGGGGGQEDFFTNLGGGGGGRGGRGRSSRMGGGMGGMPGMAGMGGGMPGGFGGGPEPSQSELPPLVDIVKPLALTLEELYKGGTKRLKITRHLKTGGQEEKILEVAYKAGWKKVCANCLLSLFESTNPIPVDSRAPIPFPLQRANGNRTVTHSVSFQFFRERKSSSRARETKMNTVEVRR